MEKSHVGMMNCWICGGGSTILIHKQLRPTLSRNMGSLPNEICSECRSLADKNDGIWMISIRDGEEPPEIIDKDTIWNPYRTGGLLLLKKEALKRFFTDNLNEPDNLIKMVDRNYYFYLNDTIWDNMGLPERGKEINNLEENLDS